MEWSDEGIVLGVRRHGEAGAIVELLTRRRGRHLGIVRGGASRQHSSLLQPGNTVLATWRARLEEHLGNYLLEASILRADRLMATAHAAFGLSHMAQLLHLLPERDPHEGLYDTTGAILDALDDAASAGQLMARFELALLGELGFGLELETCAATGGRNDLVYVSPKSGRAVSRQAGDPFADRLFLLPSFFLGGAAPPSAREVEEGLRITGHFLAVRALEPRGQGFSPARASFIAAWRRGLAAQSRG